MRGGQRFKCAMAAVALGLGLRANAAISLVNGGGNQSNMSATAFGGSGIIVASQTIDINTLPALPTATATQGSSTSTVNGDLSEATFKFTVSQLFLNGGGVTTGSGDIFFTTSIDTKYNSVSTFATQDLIALSPGIARSGPVGTGVTLESFLYDQTAGAFVFNDAEEGAPGDTLTTAAEAGTLLAGHIYEFTFSAGMASQLDPAGTGTVTLSFGPATPGPGPGATSVPLPPGVWSGLLMIGAAASQLRRLRECIA